MRISRGDMSEYWVDIWASLDPNVALKHITEAHSEIRRVICIRRVYS